MRIALISDLHGNLAALDAVLADIARSGVDQVVCLGDVATLGPQPHEVMARVRALGCMCIVGNHDAFLLDPELIHTYSEIPAILAAVDWCRGQLDASDLAFVQTFQSEHTVALPGNQTLLLFHGTPRSHMEDALATTPTDTLDEMLGGRQATVLASGHTHIQMLRQHNGMLWVNPGSVGMPFRAYVHGQPPQIMRHAEYAIVDAEANAVSVTHKRVAVDLTAVRAAVMACDNPLRAMLAAQYAQ